MRPLRSHKIISVCLLLELIVSLVSGQTLTSIVSPDGTDGDLTGRVLSFTEVGRGVLGSHALQCRTSGASNVEWQFPDGTTIESGTGEAMGSQLFQDVTSVRAALRRGPNYFSPDGQYCCVRPTTNERRCVYFTACPTLNTLSQGTVTYNAGDNTATVTCNTGFAPQDMELICDDSEMMWNEPQPACLPSCEDLDVPVNGMISYSPNTTPRFVNTMATHSCNNGFAPSPGSTRTCTDGGNSGGVWSGSTITCLRICEDLPALSNGMISYNGGSMNNRLEGNVATHNCDTGYEASRDPATRTCQSDGTWSGEEITCDPVSCGNPPTIDNAFVMSTGTTFGETATYSCETGYQLSGSSSISCLSSGSWETAPMCIAICDELTVPANGADVTYNPVDRMEGSTATHTCISGYEPSRDPATRICQSDRTWSGEDVTCELICPNLTPPANGAAIVYSDPTIPRDEGSIANYSCSSGYVVTGDMVRTCTASGWDGSEPVCTATCNDLPALTNGMVSYSLNTTPRLEGTVANHSCDTEYLPSRNPATRTCQNDRTWSGEEITCVGICPPLSLPNGTVTYFPSDTPILAGAVATHECDNGFAIIGPTTRTCMTAVSGGGVWSGTDMMCIASCEDLPDITNGVITYSPEPNSRLEEATATYECTMGLMLMGQGTRTCQNDRSWSGSEPYCQRVFLQLGDSSIASGNSELVISQVGQGSGGLVCRTDHPQCCNSTTNAAWLDPNNNVISTTPGADGFYVDYGDGFVRLNSNSTTTATGMYCCNVPVDGGGMDSFCVQLLPVPIPSPLSVPAIAGGIVAAVVIAALIIIVIIIVVVCTRRSRQKKYQPSSNAYSTVYTKQSEPDGGVATLKKIEAPTISGFPSEARVVEGEAVHWKVNVGGHPPPTLTWYRDGNKVTADYATELDDDGGLAFPSVEAKHSGVYKLVASGPSGTAEKEVTLTVVGEGEDVGEPTGPVDFTPVPVDQFGAYVADLHSSNNKKFADYYKALSSGEADHSTAIAKQHRDSNRFANILVYDDNRIVLQPIPGRDDCQAEYVNACHVDGYTNPNNFLASQGPLPGTLVDFWRMMWQERPPIIVMLTNIKEGTKIKCQQYWPDSGSQQYGPFTVTITDQQVLADYTTRTMTVQLEGDSKVLKTTQFHFTTWPDHGVPEYATPILAFHRRIKSQHNPSKGPLLVHCSAGVGRTGTYIVIDNVLDQIAAEGIVDISGAIVKARNQRMKLVQTQDQYVFIHDAILESVTCGDTQVSAGDLRRQIQKMSKVAPGKSVTGFQYQFQVLQQVTANPNEGNHSTAAKNKKLNRGNEYLPLEKHRVLLKGENSERDYVNAVFANGYKHQKAYIIAQNPLPSTIRNFWKVIYERKCAAVVMLTPLKEDGQEVCSQYWPENGAVATFGEFTVDNLGEESFPTFTVRTLSVLSKKTKQAHQVTQFHITNWRSDGSCDNLKTVTDVNEEVTKVQRRTGNKSFVVHCSDTATRSGMYCSIATTIDRCKTEGVVDVFQVVKALRVHKPGAVPSVDNYKDVFEAILVYLDSFDTYANFA